MNSDEIPLRISPGVLTCLPSCRLGSICTLDRRSHFAMYSFLVWHFILATVILFFRIVSWLGRQLESISYFHSWNISEVGFIYSTFSAWIKSMCPNLHNSTSLPIIDDIVFIPLQDLALGKLYCIASYTPNLLEYEQNGMYYSFVLTGATSSPKWIASRSFFNWVWYSLLLH